MSSDLVESAKFLITEWWILAPAGREQDALAGRTPLMGGQMPGGSRFGTLFSDRDLAERFSRVRGLGSTATPVRFEWKEPFVAFLRAMMAEGFTHFLVDPTGEVRPEQPFAIDKLIAAVTEE